jgi:hypothetical protein
VILAACGRRSGTERVRFGQTAFRDLGGFRLNQRNVFGELVALPKDPFRLLGF